MEDVRMRVLIADDDFVNRKFLEKILTEYGEVVGVDNGMSAVEEAVKALEEKNGFDLICLDIMMTRLDGYKTLEAIREAENKLETSEKIRAKVIMISALDEVVLDSIQVCDDYDAYIVGSDQVWRPAYNNIANTFLDFTSEWDVKRIAYAASFGTDQWEFSNEQTEICRSLIARFQAVSVRESSGISLCQEYLQRDALHVLDPTMLLKRTDYESLISDAYVTPIKGQIFVHILDKDEDKTILIGKIEKLKNWESFSVNCAVDEHEVYVPIEFRIQPPVEQWLLGFRKAEFVVTDSFHATVFSIIFNKPFIVYANEKRGLARFVSLLEMFGLEHRIITNSNQFTEALLAPIDFNYANQRMESLRETSLNFLYNHL